MQRRVYKLAILTVFIHALWAGMDSVAQPVATDTLVAEIASPPDLVQGRDSGIYKLSLDSTPIKRASGLTPQLAEYRGQKEFDYRSAVPEGASLWEQFWRWFWTRWTELMSREGFRVGFKAFLWVASIGILLYAILRVLGMEKVRLWIGGEGRGQGIRGEMVEDIHAIDYQASIADAEQEGRYRDAIRFHFLRSLKLMADKGIIRWNRNKTNIDYAQELSAHRLSGSFDQIRRIYEYAWYGEFAVSESDYRVLYPYFSGFDQQVTV